MDLVVADDLDTSKPKDAKDDDPDQLDPDTQNGRLFEGYVYTSTSKTLGLDLTGLNAHFADIGDGTFDVYVYVYLDADLIIGGNDADLIYGQHGSDTYRFVGLGLGSDRLVESDGANGPNDAADTLDYSGFGDGIEIDLNKYGEQSVNKATVNGAVNSIVTLFAKDAFEDVIGTAFADQIDGNQRNSRLVGGASDDEIDADDGDDIVLGGAGDDYLKGDKDKDIIEGCAGIDEIKGDKKDLVTEQDQAAGPLGLFDYLDEFRSLYARDGFYFVDPNAGNPSPTDDRPARDWVIDYLSVSPQYWPFWRALLKIREERPI